MDISFRLVLLSNRTKANVQFRLNLYSVVMATAVGKEQVKALREAAKVQLRKGEALVRKAVDGLLGYKLQAPQFQRLWQRLQDELANLFFANGLRLIRAIASLTQSKGTSRSPAFSQLLDGVRKSVATLQVGGGRAEEVAQAVVDLFAERESEVFAWLTELAAKYVSLCSLGLEPSAQQEVSGHLKDIDIIVDTDIVLSLLSEGERPHKAVEELLKRWSLIGGRLLLTPPVLEEAAYHVWRSMGEFREVQRLAPSLKPHEIHRYAKTAFVRAFCTVADGDFSTKRWDKFIGEYKGTSPTDVRKMEAILEDYGFQKAQDFRYDNALARTVCDEIYAIRKIPAGAFVLVQPELGAGPVRLRY
jgi:hypothetical protein